MIVRHIGRVEVMLHLARKLGPCPRCGVDAGEPCRQVPKDAARRFFFPDRRIRYPHKGRPRA